MTDRSRNIYADMCKGLLILLMVICHISKNENFNRFIYLFHMPVFIFISGRYYRYSEPAEFFEKLFKRLYVPFIVLNISALLLTNMFVSLHFYTPDYSISINNFFLRLIKIIFMISEEHIFGPLWFIRYLFWGKIVVYFANFANHRVKFPYMLSGILFSVFYFVTIIYIRSSFLTGILNFSFLFVLGKIICNKLDELNIVYFFLSFFSLVTIYISNYSLDLNYFGFGLDVILTFSGYITVYYICKALLKIKYATKIFTELGKFTFEIMAGHILVFKFVNLVIVLLLNLNLSAVEQVIIPLNNQNGYIENVIFLLYLLLGIYIPILLIKLERWIKCIIYEKFKKEENTFCN